MGGVFFAGGEGAALRDAEFVAWVGDFNYRVDRPPGFAPDTSGGPEAPSVNAQLYDFVHEKVCGLFCCFYLFFEVCLCVCFVCCCFQQQTHALNTPQTLNQQINKKT